MNNATPDPHPTAPPTAAPASDEQIMAWKELGAGGRLFIPADVIDRFVARIEADRAENDRLRSRIKELEAARLILEWQ